MFRLQILFVQLVQGDTWCATALDDDNVDENNDIKLNNNIQSKD